MATYIPNAARVAAGGNGFLETNVPGYKTDYHGIEIGLVKRLSNRWMGRVGFSWRGRGFNPRPSFLVHSA